MGKSNWAVNSINQIVKIDAVIDVKELSKALGLPMNEFDCFQKRFCLVSLVDTYSSVCSFHICDTENSLGVARAVAHSSKNT
ncbi:hypothetical protein CCZ01_03865 [Helicobacter monodelphidis]|nr:hypothetical protein CCZ01_03865 [Helicobacter sp. 15-1451]